jgi:hypothetical protein
MIAKAWSHESRFLSATAADEVYRRMVTAAWSRPDGEGLSAIHFGLSYTQGDGAVCSEIPTIPDFLNVLAERISLSAKMPCNYVQCHCMDPIGQVRPHRDPAGMIVPMLTLGQARTFRVGGNYPEDVPKVLRAVESHKPEAEILMQHGDLLTFNGGRTAHSMFPARKDDQFKANGYDYRISILFRWTTSIMRALGPNRARWSPTQIEQHEREYAAAQKNWMDMHAAQPSLFSPISRNKSNHAISRG